MDRTVLPLDKLLGRNPCPKRGIWAPAGTLYLGLILRYARLDRPRNGPKIGLFRAYLPIYGLGPDIG